MALKYGAVRFLQAAAPLSCVVAWFSAAAIRYSRTRPETYALASSSSQVTSRFVSYASRPSRLVNVLSAALAAML